MAPLMPQAMYRLGRTVLPVCPTWRLASMTPASTMARLLDTSPPSSLARASSLAKPSLLPTPRPPLTRILAWLMSVMTFSSLTVLTILTRLIFGVVEIDLVVNDFALAAGVGGEFLHDAGADGGHLRAVVLTKNGGHQVAAEGGTGHTELFLFLADFQLGGISGEAGDVAGRNTGTQVAADGGGTNQEDAGFELFDNLGDGLGIGLGKIGLKMAVVAHEHLVGTGGDEALSLVFDVLAQEDGHYFFAQGVGQLAGLT